MSAGKPEPKLYIPQSIPFYRWFVDGDTAFALSDFRKPSPITVLPITPAFSEEIVLSEENKAALDKCFNRIKEIIASFPKL
jgi:hypothetical protein